MGWLGGICFLGVVLVVGWLVGWELCHGRDVACNVSTGHCTISLHHHHPTQQLHPSKWITNPQIKYQRGGF
jgi:hypothetical protein